MGASIWEGGKAAALIEAVNSVTGAIVAGELAPIEVTGTTPTVVALAGRRYIAGELTSLDFTPCSDGMCDIIFTSGATATVLTLPQTGVTMPDGFQVEANKTYELNFLDGMGVAQSWPTASS